MRLALILVLSIFPLTAHAGIYGAAYDGLTSPGNAVTLRAKFERTYTSFFRPDIRGKTVSFKVNGLSVGSSKTDSQGIASISYTPASDGALDWSATLVSKSFTVRGRLTVLPRASKCVVFDIDGTISDLPDWQVPFKGATAKAFPNSPELVRELAREYHVIYLTARDDFLRPETEAFMALHNLPMGTVIYNEFGRVDDPANGLQLVPGNHGKFKASVLRKLQSIGLDIVAGIGNADTDAEAYEAVRILSYVRNTKTFAQSFSFQDYLVLRQRLLSDGVLTTPRTP